MRAKQSILIVDDNIQLNEMMKTILESENYIVKQAFNGKEAIEKALSEDIDIVIMDIMMPKMNGESAIKAIYYVNPKIKFIIISGNMAVINQEEIKKYNVVACYDKPFHIPDVLNTIKKFMKI